MNSQDLLNLNSHKFHFINSLTFGILLALVGGFLDAYTFILRDGVFANAQTGNIVLIGVYASKGKWIESLKLIPPISAFISGVVVSEFLKNSSDKIFKKHWAIIILLLECIILVIIGFLPLSVPDIIITVTISFIASVQVSSFRVLVDSPYSTTMVTGNLRSAVDHLYFGFKRNDRISIIRSLRYFIIIFAFIIGALAGSLLISILHVRSIWIAALILFGVTCFLIFSDRKNQS